MGINRRFGIVILISLIVFISGVGVAQSQWGAGEVAIHYDVAHEEVYSVPENAEVYEYDQLSERNKDLIITAMKSPEYVFTEEQMTAQGFLAPENASDGDTKTIYVKFTENNIVKYTTTVMKSKTIGNDMLFMSGSIMAVIGLLSLLMFVGAYIDRGIQKELGIEETNNM